MTVSPLHLIVNQSVFTTCVYITDVFAAFIHVIANANLCRFKIHKKNLKLEAQLVQRDRAMHYVNKFVLYFTSYESYKGFTQQK